MPVAALVVGIVGLVLSCVPCLGMYALPLTVIAVILGLVGRKQPAGKGLAIAGMVCGVIGTAIASWWIYAYLTTKAAVQTEPDKHAAEMQKLGSGSADTTPTTPTAPSH